MKTRILSYLLVFSMILALLPASALAEGESTATPHITATVEHALDSNQAETGQITAQIEAYLTDTKNQSHTVKPCDIIFLIEQSTFMNTKCYLKGPHSVRSFCLPTAGECAILNTISPAARGSRKTSFLLEERPNE